MSHISPLAKDRLQSCKQQACKLPVGIEDESARVTLGRKVVSIVTKRRHDIVCSPDGSLELFREMDVCLYAIGIAPCQAGKAAILENDLVFGLETIFRPTADRGLPLKDTNLERAFEIPSP